MAQSLPYVRGSWEGSDKRDMIVLAPEMGTYFVGVSFFYEALSLHFLSQDELAVTRQPLSNRCASSAMVSDSYDVSRPIRDRRNTRHP